MPTKYRFKLLYRDLSIETKHVLEIKHILDLEHHDLKEISCMII
jgi:hypothetical protein